MTADALSTAQHTIERILRECQSVILAYSGGVDSALLAALAHRVLGDNALACIATSPSYPQRELHAAIELADRIGIRRRIVDTREHLDPHYAANPENRCYYCKSELHHRLRAIADDQNFATIIDGANADDAGDHRPGMIASKELGVRSPLLEANITKSQVRALAQRLNLPVWNKPSMACLASRIPHHTPVTIDVLDRIERAEDAIANLGFTQYRLRHHGDIARLELPATDLPRAIAQRERIIESITALGWRFVTLDLAGFSSGSLNPTPAHPSKAPAP